MVSLLPSSGVGLKKLTHYDGARKAHPNIFIKTRFSNTNSISQSSSFGSAVVLATLFCATVALAAHPPAYGPQIYCRDTNTSIYADVCTPSIATAQVPVERKVKNVQDNEYCYEQVRPSVRRLPGLATTTQVRAPETPLKPILITKSETMKVTTCSAAETGYGHHGYAKPEEHQYC
ncbi:Uncharacterized protein FKW44_015859, partial [Caligus rogercresseyi]